MASGAALRMSAHIGRFSLPGVLFPTLTEHPKGELIHYCSPGAFVRGQDRGNGWDAHVWVSAVLLCSRWTRSAKAT